MTIVELKTGELYNVKISPVYEVDYQKITSARYWFNWKEEIKYNVYKLCVEGTDDILGLISLNSFVNESRIEIRLLAVSKENRGKNKRFDHIAGNLIAFAGIQALKEFGQWACISLIPKTELIHHYMHEYSMLRAGRSLFLDGKELIGLVRKYDHG